VQLARSFVRGLMNTTINLRPDLARGELRVELQGQANPRHDAAVTARCTELNTTETATVQPPDCKSGLPEWVLGLAVQVLDGDPE